MCLNLKYLRSSREGNITSKCMLWTLKVVAIHRISLNVLESVHCCRHMVRAFSIMCYIFITLILCYFLFPFSLYDTRLTINLRWNNNIRRSNASWDVKSEKQEICSPTTATITNDNTGSFSACGRHNNHVYYRRWLCCNMSYKTS